MIYLLSCQSYGKQYEGNTTNNFKSRWNNYKADVRKAENGNMENVKQKFLQSHFLQRDHQGFLKDVEARLIDKTRLLIQPKGSFTEWEHLKLCILMALILELTISSLFRLICTFTVIFGSPSTRVLSSVTAIAFFGFCLFDRTCLEHVFCVFHRH